MIVIDKISKSFCNQEIFNNISFKVNSKERIGVTGKNGHGKTTLFKLIYKDETPDDGSIIIPKDYKIGYLKQEINFKGPSSLLEGAIGLPSSDSSEHWKVEKILSGLGFSQEQMNSNPKELSGGFQIRLNLAKVLLSEPDLLLLDEPNNYLDITSIRWLSRFLTAWKSELMLITHDRSFMDKVVTHTIGIHRKKILKIAGNTEKLYNQIAREEEIHEKTRVNDEKKKREIDLFISRFRAKARLAGMVQSRIKTISKMQSLNKLDKIKNMDFSFTNKPLSSKYAASVKDLSFAYDKKFPIIENFNITIGSKDRICVIGENGKGKTTLLKLLSKTLTQNKGEIKYHPSASIGYYEQSNINRLDDSKTVYEEIISANCEIDQQRARDICGTMMFEQDHALKKTKILSGGEKSRVMLGKLLATPVNILLLDEPTNHLDMHSCDSLVEALNEFDGAVLIVTHNEMLLHAVSERLIIFHENKIEIQENSYSQFLSRGGWNDEDIDKGFSDGSQKKESNKREIRKKRTDFILEKNKILNPLKKKVTSIELNIEKLEESLSKLNNDLITASNTQNHEIIKDSSKKLHKTREMIDVLFSELEILTSEYEEKEREFSEIEKAL